MARKSFYSISLEESDVVVDENVTDHELAQTQAEIRNDSEEIQDDIATVEESQEVVEELQEQVETNEEALDNNEVTDELVQASNESFMYAMGKLGVPKDRVHYHKVSCESYVTNHEKLKISNEGIKDFISKIIEKIKAFFKTIKEKLKKLYAKIVSFFTKSEKKIDDIVKQAKDIDFKKLETFEYPDSIKKEIGYRYKFFLMAGITTIKDIIDVINPEEIFKCAFSQNLARLLIKDRDAIAIEKEFLGKLASTPAYRFSQVLNKKLQIANNPIIIIDTSYCSVAFYYCHVSTLQYGHDEACIEVQKYEPGEKEGLPNPKLILTEECINTLKKIYYVNKDRGKKIEKELQNIEKTLESLCKDVVNKKDNINPNEVDNVVANAVITGMSFYNKVATSVVTSSSLNIYYLIRLCDWILLEYEKQYGPIKNKTIHKHIDFPS